MRVRYSSAIILIMLLNAVEIVSRNAGGCGEWHLDAETVLVETNNKMLILVDAKDKGISSTIRREGWHNGLLIEFMKRFVQQGEDIVHVGAHIGLQVLTLAKYAVQNNISRVHVWAFEPNQKCYTLLTKSLYINDLQNIITVFKTAVTDVEGIAELAVRNSDTSQAEIIPVASTGRKADQKYQVKTMTLDSRITSAQKKFSLVYLSCNTYQIQAMVGMKQLLLRNKDVSVLLDWHYGRNGHRNIDELIRILKNFKQNEYKLLVLNEKLEAKSKIEEQSWSEVADFMEVTNIKEGKLLFLPSSKLSLLK